MIKFKDLSESKVFAEEMVTHNEMTKKLHLTKLNAFADHKKILLKWFDSSLIGSKTFFVYYNFLLFPNHFQKASSSRFLKPGIV